MNYCDVWVRGTKGIFSWEREGEVSLGSRVIVMLRNKKKVGIVVNISNEKPEFKTQKILEVWEDHFLPSEYIEIAKRIAEENFTSFEKVLSLMVPEKFCAQKSPEKREISYGIGSEYEALRGEKQKLAVELIQQNGGEISEEALRKNISLLTIKNLVAKGVLTEKQGRLHDTFSATQKSRPNFNLTEFQEKVYTGSIHSKKPVLIFGVTGSGKTEIYKKLSAEILKKDASKQVLLLVPEIALTPQLLSEFYSVFGNEIAVWHSKLSEGEKVQEWARVQSGEARILIGARSAVLVPLRNPALIILDEEHEWTFKNEFAPRFQAHDVVEHIVRAFGSKLVLGSATPRLESFEKCTTGEWTRLDLTTRVHEVQLPQIELVDLANEAKKGNFSPLSEKLVEELSAILRQKKQAILFLNKRGFSGSTMCKVCGHTFECPNCSANMKLHSRMNAQKFICHICGHLENFTTACPECKAENFQFRGWGTQQLEEVLQKTFSGIRVMRADADSVTGKEDFEKLMDTFHEGKADVLLGTQMVAKGLDFEHVDLVGVILADVGLTLPDFRSEERVFQILTQVSGRAGRRKTRGKIVIQTFRPDEKIFEFVRNHDSEGFLKWQKTLRQSSKMPPFSSIAKITFSDVKKEVAFREAKKFFSNLTRGLNPLLEEGRKQASPTRGLNPLLDEKEWQCHWAPAFFPRTHNKYHFHVFVQTPDKQKLLTFLHAVDIPENAKVDVRPMSLL
ncbi:primosomal protein N' [Candidatus Gracilibacteria bacterium]|nr:primosomal protein N' [Candidatus Gracilibacteria bacterium]